MAIVLQSAGGLTGALVTTLSAVAVFAVVGWLTVRWLSARGPRWGRTAGGQLEVLERLPLDFKSSLYVVRRGDRTWLVGCGDAGAPRLLAELETEPAPDTDSGGVRGG